jgi:hypothetical protein
MKTCPKCGVEHNFTRKFCSISCANSRTWSEEDKKKKSIGGKKFYETEEGEINKWIKGQRNSRQGFRPLSDPEVQEKVEDDYIIPYSFEEDNSKFVSGGDVWFVDE